MDYGGIVYRSVTRYVDPYKEFHASHRTGGRRGKKLNFVDKPYLMNEDYELEFAPYVETREPVDADQVERRSDCIKMTWKRYQ